MVAPNNSCINEVNFLMESILIGLKAGNTSPSTLAGGRWCLDTRDGSSTPITWAMWDNVIGSIAKQFAAA